MQVSSATDNITHAVISNKTAVNLSVATSAEFFNILSSSLYTDQILAVVRETICNAWDAHIEAGITDKPISITITDTEFLIRDFGNGIAKEDFTDIYGVYGKSTKKQNSEVTGGFGLGCKAPFAYVDSFEVTSWNQGVKTIYSLSKSNAVVDGLPAITEIVSIPTDQSGLQVRLSIKSKDAHSFKNKIKKIIYEGGIYASVNNSIEKTINFNELEDNFIIVPYDNSIKIKYGNVLYTLENNVNINEEYNVTDNILKKLIINVYENTLILVAPPNSLSITPSRESISLQEKSINTLNQLLNEFNNKYLSLFDKTSLINLYVNELKNKEIPLLLKNKPNFHLLTVIKSYKDLIKTVCLSNYNRNYEDIYNSAVIKILYKNKFINKTVFCSYLLNNNSHINIKSIYNTVIKYLLKQSIDINEIKYTNNYQDFIINNFYHCYYNNQLNLVKPTFVLHTTKVIDKNRLTTFSNEYINTSNYIHLQINKNNPNLQKIRDVFNKNKSVVFIDLTVKHDWEIKKEVKKNTKGKGLPKASAIINSNKFNRTLYKTTTDRLINPDYIVELDSRNASFFCSNYKSITSLIGDQCGVWHTKPQKEKYTKLNVPDVYEKLGEYLINVIETNRAVQRLIVNNEYDTRLIRTILNNPTIAKQFDLLFIFKKEDIEQFNLINCFRSYVRRSDSFNVFYMGYVPTIKQNYKLEKFKLALESLKFKWVDTYNLANSLESETDYQNAINFIKGIIQND